MKIFSKNTVYINFIWVDKLWAGGKPSIRLPPGGLVELFSKENNCLVSLSENVKLVSSLKYGPYILVSLLLPNKWTIEAKYDSGCTCDGVIQEDLAYRSK